MKRITCKECVFWDVYENDPKLGECREGTPTTWRETDANKWCGKAKPLKTYNEMETKDA